MQNLNKHFLKVERRYLFSQIEERLKQATERLGKENIINLGIGDICHPICPAVKNAFIHAIEEMGDSNSIKGYGPSLGYPFLRKAIRDTYYAKLGLSEHEIFISDGINAPITQILDVFDENCSIAIANPAYPVYLDNAIMRGFSDKLETLPLIEKNQFNPVPPDKRVDLVYLCSPANPTGTAMNRTELQRWVDWANDNKAILLFDAAYNSFIDHEDIPSSIFEIAGSKSCCIEFMSFSKSAGFTGLRLGSIAMSDEIHGINGVNAYKLFKQYLETVSNGISYPVQKAGLAALGQVAQAQIQQEINGYKYVAKKLKTTLTKLGYQVFGGDHCPYLWIKVRGNYTSQEFSNLLLEKGVVVIPGDGFGLFGQGFFRLSCLINEKTLEKALNFFTTGMEYGQRKSEVFTL